MPMKCGPKAGVLPAPYRTNLSGVYAIINNSHQKVYIGSARHISKRLNLHRHELIRNCHSNRHLQRSFNKCPESLCVEIIEEFPSFDKDRLLSREQFWMDFYRSWERHTGYNISPTAESCAGIKHPPEYGQNISARQKGKKMSPERYAIHMARRVPSKYKPRTPEQVEAMRQVRLGSKMPKSACLKISEALKANPYQAKPVHQFTLSGEFIKTFRTAKDAETELGKRLNIAEVCKGLRRYSGGFFWSYAKEPISMRPKKNRSGLRRAMIKLLPSGDEVEFASSIAAAKSMGLNRNTIYVAALRNGTAGGFKWKFKEADNA